MELKEFISNTLTEIANGVSDAIEASEGKGYLVNPSPNKLGAPYTIHFELSVESSKEGSASIKVIGGSMEQRNVNHINFDICMTLPTSGNKERPKRPVQKSGGTSPHT